MAQAQVMLGFLFIDCERKSLYRVEWDGRCDTLKKLLNTSQVKCVPFDFTFAIYIPSDQCEMAVNGFIFGVTESFGNGLVVQYDDQPYIPWFFKEYVSKRIVFF